MNPVVSSQTIYTWVQKMNNSAALCLQIGQYERAIKSIAKALQLSRSHIEGSSSSDQEMSDSKPTQLLSLDDCIHYSECYFKSCNIHRKLRTTDSRGRISDNRSEETIRKRFLERRQERRNKLGNQFQPSDSQFLYQQLIQVPDLTKESDHSKQLMVLSLISIFNLAVVCHLRAMNERASKTGNSRQATTDLTKALKLYEVAYQGLQKHCVEEAARSSIQFKLVLCNNLSHVHHLMGNESQQTAYLQEVLSVVMSLVDSYRPWNYADVVTSTERSTDFTRHRKCIDLDGFLANAAPLLTERVCADAA